MALPKSQLQPCLKALGEFLQRTRPPAHLRDQVDLHGDIKGATVEIYELRPAFNNKSELVQGPVAKMKWIDKRKTWRLFWQRADLKWHSYTPLPEGSDIEELFAEVERDPHGCFFG